MEETIEYSDEQKSILRAKQAELLRLLDAVASLSKSSEWATLKEIVFDKSVASIEKQIISESLTGMINSNKLYKLQGEWAWAKQYADMDRFADTLKIQLEEIKKKLR